MFKDDYLKKIYDSAKQEASTSEIAQSLKSSGRFLEHAEWRMGTCAEVEIAEENGTYIVRVEYDYKFECTCPTLERAIGMAGLFLGLIIKLDQQVGWPSNA
jgi:hypothetical protein